MGFLFFMLVPLFFFFLHPILFTNIPPILIEKKTMRIIQVLKKNAHRFHFRIFVLILQGINLSLLRDCNKHRVILQRQQARTIIRTRRRNKRSSKVVRERLNLKPPRHPHEIQPACVKRRLQRELLSNNHEHKHKHSNNKHNLYYFFKKIIKVVLVVAVLVFVLVVVAEKLTLKPALHTRGLDFVRMPRGFKIETFADNLGGSLVSTPGPNNGARLLALKDDTVFVTVSKQGKIYALEDKDKDAKVETMSVFLENLNNPHGFFFYKDWGYIGEEDRVKKKKKKGNKHKKKKSHEDYSSSQEKR